MEKMNRKNFFNPPPNSGEHVVLHLLLQSLNFESLRNLYFVITLEKEKELVLEQMAQNAKSFEDWLFILGHVKRKQLHCLAESKAVKFANSVFEITILVQNYNIARKKEIAVIKKALKIAIDDKELKELQSICAEKGLMLSYNAERAKRAVYCDEE